MHCLIRPISETSVQKAGQLEQNTLLSVITCVILVNLACVEVCACKLSPETFCIELHTLITTMYSFNEVTYSEQSGVFAAGR